MELLPFAISICISCHSLLSSASHHSTLVITCTYRSNVRPPPCAARCRRSSVDGFLVGVVGLVRHGTECPNKPQAEFLLFFLRFC